MTVPARIAQLVVALVFILTIPRCSGQITNVTDDQRTPMPGEGHNYIGILNEIVNPANGSLTIQISLPMPPSRGLTLPFGFSYNSNGIIQMDGSGSSPTVVPNKEKNFLGQGGWSYDVPQLSANLVNLPGKNPTYPSATCPVYTEFVFADANGSRHAMDLALPNISTCNSVLDSSVVAKYSGGDRYYQASTQSGAYNVQATPFSIIDKHGTLFHFPLLSGYGGCGGDCGIPDYVEDRNGNEINFSISTSASGLPITMKDTSGRTALSISSFGATAGDSVSVSGQSAPYKVIWGSTPYSFSIPITAVAAESNSFCNTTLYAPVASGTMPVVTSIQLPDGNSYQFQYDPVSGQLSKITYPTGAYVSYVWGPSDEFTQQLFYAADEKGADGAGSIVPNQCKASYKPFTVKERTVFDGVNTTQIQKFNYDANFSTPYTWTTTVSTQDELTTGTPSFDTVYSYGAWLLGCDLDFCGFKSSSIPVEGSIVYKDTTGNVLRTVSKAWYPGYADLLQSETTTLNNGQASQVSYSYSQDWWANLTQVNETDFGAKGVGSLLRQTINTYAAFPYDRPCKVQIEDGSGTVVAETDTLFDGGTTLCGSPGTPVVTAVSNLPANTHDETHYSATSTYLRGNATSVTRKCFAGKTNCTDATTTYTYDETGQVLSVTDPCGNATCADVTGASHTTTFCYLDSCAKIAQTGNTNAYVTKVTRPTVNNVTAATYYTHRFSDGQVSSSTDENLHPTTYQYNTKPTKCAKADALDRLSEVDYPDGGITQYCYDDSVPSVTTYTLLNSSTWKISVLTMDGLGREIQTQLNSAYCVDTVYDGIGRVQTVSNPASTCSPSTDVVTTYAYDGIGRKTQQIDSDGTSGQTWSYNGNTVTHTDEASNQWQHTSDALGRLTVVMEPKISAQASPTETDYTYDTLGNLLKVTQNGLPGDTARVRNFNYDSFSRLLCSSNPENSGATCPTLVTTAYTSGTVGYSYDANGNLSSKTDARGITTTYSYDALNRLTLKQYSDGVTAPAYYGYDSTSITLGTTHVTTSNVTGRPSWICVEINGNTCQTMSAYSYDTMGRLATTYNITPSNPTTGAVYTASAGYDLAGDMTSLTYPDGRVVGQSFDNASRLSSVNYTSWGATSVATPYLTVNSYDPAGHPTATTLGNGITTAAAYNNRLEPSSLAYLNGTANVWKKTLTWTPNGNLQFGSDVVAGTTRQYAYDALNRLTLAQDIAGTVASTGQSTDSSVENNNNLLQTFQGLGSGGWSAVSANMTPNNVAAPDGTLTADSMVGTGSIDSYVMAGASNPTLYDGSNVTGSVWLRVPNGTLNTHISILDVGNLGWDRPGDTAVALTTTWQQFSVSSSTQNGLSSLQLAIGGQGTVINGQEVDIWGPQLRVASTNTTVTNYTPFSQQIGRFGWVGYCAANTSNMTLNTTAVTAPDGTNTATGYVMPSSEACSSGGDLGAWTNIGTPLTIGQTYTASVWLRGASGGETLAYGLNDCLTVPVTLTPSWQRFSYTFSAINSGVVNCATGSRGFEFIGTSPNSTYYVWGAQTEIASSAGQYVATLDSPLTATADSTNVLPSSDQAGGHGWGISAGTFSANTVTAPDGTLTADTASSTGANTYIRLLANNPALYDGAQVTASIYMAVPSGSRTVTFLIEDSATSGGGVAASANVTVTTTWQRFDITGTLGHGLANVFLNIGGGTQISAGNPLYLWGAQMVMGTAPGPVISTQNTTTNVATGATAYLAANGMDQSYSYDAFGNMVSSGNFNFQQAYTTANQLSGWTYDASGNLLSDGLGNIFTYDAEGRISGVAGYSYIYDADGNRVSKQGAGATDHIYFGGREVARLFGGQWTDLVYGAGSLLAEVPGTQTGAPIYRMVDHLGTQVGTLSSTGVPLSLTDYTPFGQIFTGGSTDPYKFTGKERDSESGNDYFEARYYASSMGRFMSPDWSASPEAIPYANLEYPQTLNLYSYAGNNPLSRTDPDGHCTNGGKQQGFWWCLFHDSDQDAARARQNLVGLKNISINGKTPADAAKGLSNTQTVQLERSVFNYISSQAMGTPGMTLALMLIPGGAEEVGSAEIAAASDRAVAAGAATQWIVKTGESALAKDITTNITAQEFGANLEASGYAKSVSKDGVATIYSKGNETYSVYPNAKSTGGPSAQLRINGADVAKIRLQQ